MCTIDEYNGTIRSFTLRHDYQTRHNASKGIEVPRLMYINYALYVFFVFSRLPPRLFDSISGSSFSCLLWQCFISCSIVIYLPVKIKCKQNGKRNKNRINQIQVQKRQNTVMRFLIALIVLISFPYILMCGYRMKGGDV